jgi:hypothetical protein
VRTPVAAASGYLNKLANGRWKESFQKEETKRIVQVEVSVGSKSSALSHRNL